MKSVKLYSLLIKGAPNPCLDPVKSVLYSMSSTETSEALSYINKILTSTKIQNPHLFPYIDKMV